MSAACVYGVLGVNRLRAVAPLDDLAIEIIYLVIKDAHWHFRITVKTPIFREPITMGRMSMWLWSALIVGMVAGDCAPACKNKPLHECDLSGCAESHVTSLYVQAARRHGFENRALGSAYFRVGFLSWQRSIWADNADKAACSRAETLRIATLLARFPTQLENWMSNMCTFSLVLELEQWVRVRVSSHTSFASRPRDWHRSLAHNKLTGGIPENFGSLANLLNL